MARRASIQLVAVLTRVAALAVVVVRSMFTTLARLLLLALAVLDESESRKRY